MDLRQTVLDRLKETGVSRYLLARRLELDGIKRRAVFNWLSGKGETNTKTLGLIFGVLGLSIVPLPVAKHMKANIAAGIKSGSPDFFESWRR